MQSRGDGSLLCVLCCSPDCKISIADTKNTCCPCLWSWQKLKMTCGIIHRTPLADPSCFTAQLSSMPSRKQLLWTTISSATASNAQGLCQTCSVSQIVCLFRSSAEMTRKERHGPSVAGDNIIRQTDGHKDKNTSVDVTRAPLQSAADGLWKVRWVGLTC